MSYIDRHKTLVRGAGAQTLVFVHGYGCDQTMWSAVEPEFTAQYQTIIYDLAGMGTQAWKDYDFTAYQRLEAHAKDLVAILTERDLTDCVLVGHSVGATIACLAALIAPERVRALALVAPSPCFINEGDYVGGFDRAAIDSLIGMMEENYLGWTDHVAPIIAGQPEDGAATTRLKQSFCSAEPTIARHFARVTFMADYRNEMAKVTHPALILQCSDDALAPVAVGEWLDANMARSTLRVIDATGHCPHITDPEITVQELGLFLDQLE
ncbi:MULTISPECIES: alpha/beta fold hydrolase [unclassified Marinovum]